MLEGSSLYFRPVVSHITSCFKRFERNLRNYRQFYVMIPDFEIWNACVPNLTWAHFREILSVSRYRELLNHMRLRNRVRRW